jgi:glucose-1-phosphate cytidylyltransferase
MDDIAKIPVFILCGGLGTRIKEETELKPKPMVPIGPYPILWHVMHLYRRHGFRKFILCTGFKSEVIKAFFLNYHSMHSDFTVDLKTNHLTLHSTHHEEDWEVTVAYTGELALTGARLAVAASKYLGDAPHAAVTYGDGLTDADLAEEFKFHQAHGKLGTVVGVNPPSRFGELKVANSQVEEFEEKPHFGEKWINGGFFFFKNEFFRRYLTSQENCVLEKGPLTHLAQDKELQIYKHPGFWACMDTQRDRDQLTALWNSGKAPWIQSRGKKILVTGHQGYIGVHMVDILKKEGYHVTGCDLALFDGCEWEQAVSPDFQYLKDFRELTIEELKGFDGLIHLAAISNDPMGALDPEITYSINLQGTIDLAKKAKEAGIPLFLFASSCSIYGQGKTLDIDESGEMAPLTSYAISKVEAEKQLEPLSSSRFKVVSLRNATAYGLSPMLRIDLVVNNLVACALAKGELRVTSDGTPWRPLIHCRDIARAFAAFLKTPPEEAYLAVNVGASDQNFQVKEIVAKIQKRLPHLPVVFTGEVGTDPRNYRVDFSLLRKKLPHFRLEYDVDKGIEELLASYLSRSFSLEDFEGDKYVRLRSLKKRLYALC